MSISTAVGRGLEPLDVVVCIVYVLVMLFATWRFRNIKDLVEYALAGHKFGYPLLAMSLAATYIGPGFSMGATGKGFSHGILDYLIFLPFCLQTIVVGCFVAPRLAALEGCMTIGDVFARKSGRSAQMLAGIFSVGICVLFSGFLGKVAGQTVSELTGIPFVWAVVLVTAITATYTVTGGFGADVATDAVQFLIMLIIVPIFLIVVLLQPEFNASSAGVLVKEHTRMAYNDMGFLGFFGAAVSFFLGETLIPPYATRAMAAPTPAQSRNAFVLAGLFGVFWLAIVTSIGIAGTTLSVEASNPDHVFITLAARVLPTGMWGLLLVAIASIVMSSQDSVLNSGAVSLVRDIMPIQGGNRGIDLAWARGFTIFIAVIGGVTAGWLPGIIESLLFIYSLWAPAVLVPLLLMLFSDRLVKHAPWVSMVCGVVCSGAWHFIPALKALISPILPGILAASVGFWVVAIYESQARSVSEA